jgi:hypothetical protein
LATLRDKIGRSLLILSIKAIVSDLEIMLGIRIAIALMNKPPLGNSKKIQKNMKVVGLSYV